MSLFQKNKSSDSPGINVELKVIGVFSEQHISVVTTLYIPDKATVKTLIKTALKEGKIEKNVYRSIQGVRPPLSLMLNGSNVTDSRKEKISLNDGDQVTIFMPLSGG